MANSAQPIIIKKVKKAAHAHHGGAWKIAYADFVTAMMAFFLLMWLISMTTQEQKTGLAEYFAPAALSLSNSGAGGMLAGTAMDKSGNRASAPRDTAMGTPTKEDGARQANSGRANDRRDRRSDAGIQAQHSAMASLRQALQNMPEIAELSRNIVIEPAREGLDISLVDQNGRSMFAEGSVQPYERARLVLVALAPTLRRMPNRVSVTGHTTTARPGSAQAVDAWSLTAGRALSVQEILSGAGLPNDRFAAVVGRADTEPMFPDNPYTPANRRVTITLLNEAPPLPPNPLR
ncbi:MAG: flagellar motor protein MotB [Caldilineaceae bacterium]